MFLAFPVRFHKLNTDGVFSELVIYYSWHNNRQRSLGQDSSLPSVLKCLWADELQLCFFLLTVCGAPGEQFSCTYEQREMKSFPSLTWPSVDILDLSSQPFKRSVIFFFSFVFHLCYKRTGLYLKDNTFPMVVQMIVLHQRQYPLKHSRVK